VTIAPVVKPRAAAAVTTAPVVLSPKPIAPQDPNAPVILYQNRLTTASVAAGGTGGQLVLSPNTFDRWQGTIAPASSAVITFTLPNNTSLDCLAVGAHNLGTLSGGATLRCEYAVTVGGAWVDFAPLQTRNGGDTRPVMFIRATPVTVRQIRFRVTSGTGPYFVGVIYAGLKLQMPHPIYGGHSPLPLNATTDYFNNRSESGEWIGRQIRRRGFETSVELPRLKPDWYRANFQPFVDSAKENPFFFAWRPVSYPDEVGYCWTDGDIRASNIGGGRPELSVTLSLKAHG
jgi:hypothetical protein